MGQFKNSTFDGNVVPSTNNTKNLGTSSKKWKSVYATDFVGSAHNSYRLKSINKDERVITPSSVEKTSVTASFVARGNLTGTSTVSDFADMLILNTWGDNTGGYINALTFNKRSEDGQAIFHYQANNDATKWNAPKQIAYTDSTLSGRIVTSLQGTWLEGSNGERAIIHSTSNNNQHTTLFSGKSTNGKFSIYKYQNHLGIGYESDEHITAGQNSLDKRIAFFEDGSIRPQADNAQDLGQAGLKWRRVYATTFNGNSSSATKLQTARYINDIQFDGTKNVRIANSWNYELGTTNATQYYYIFAKANKAIGSGNNHATILLSGVGNYGRNKSRNILNNIIYSNR